MSKQIVADSEAKWPSVERRKVGGFDWQSSVERDKATLARLLHDETGGLLVAAVMDITSVEKQLKDKPDFQGRLARARSALDQAIEINRRVIEELRPTLLENFGLIAALKWHFAEVCKAAHINCHHLFSADDKRYASGAAIALYRVAETMLSVLMAHHPTELQLELVTTDTRLTLRAIGSRIKLPFDGSEAATASALMSARGRTVALGGNMRVAHETPDLAMECEVALSVIVAD